MSKQAQTPQHLRVYELAYAGDAGGSGYLSGIRPGRNSRFQPLLRVLGRILTLISTMRCRQLLRIPPRRRRHRSFFPGSPF